MPGRRRRRGVEPARDGGCGRCAGPARPRRTHRPWGDACRLVAPVLVAAGTAVLLLGSDRPGQHALALTAAATAAAAAAAVLRALRDGAPEALLLELVVACVLAVAAGGALLSGVSLPTLAALLTALAVCLVRVLPAMVIDVPDEELLDLDRVAVTAWSAQLPGQRRRKRVRTAEVTRQVGESRRLLDAAVVAVVLTAGVGVPVVLAQGGSLLPRTGAIALGCCAAVALPLHARAVRGVVGRTALLLGGIAAAVATLAALIFSADDLQRVVLSLTAAAAGACTVVAAVALGRGWRSVRWARLADATEGWPSPWRCPPRCWPAMASNMSARWSVEPATTAAGPTRAIG